MNEPRQLKPNESDSMIEHALIHNKTKSIAYKGKWLPKGWLEKALDSAKQGDTV